MLDDTFYNSPLIILIGRDNAKNRSKTPPKIRLLLFFKLSADLIATKDHMHDSGLGSCSLVYNRLISIWYQEHMDEYLKGDSKFKQKFIHHYVISVFVIG